METLKVGDLVRYTQPLEGVQDNTGNHAYEAQHGASLGAVGLVTELDGRDVKVLFVPLLNPCVMYAYQLELIERRAAPAY
jgi:hypothetical protein